jgi:hypothetical protein
MVQLYSSGFSSGLIHNGLVIPHIPIFCGGIGNFFRSNELIVTAMYPWTISASGGKNAMVKLNASRPLSTSMAGIFRFLKKTGGMPTVGSGNGRKSKLKLANSSVFAVNDSAKRRIWTKALVPGREGEKYLLVDCDIGFHKSSKAQNMFERIFMFSGTFASWRNTYASTVLTGPFVGSRVLTLLLVCSMFVSTPSSFASSSSAFNRNPSAFALNCADCLLITEISPSEMVCKWPLNMKIPPSPKSSPATPTITNISNKRFRFLQRGNSFFLWSAKYSPTRPAVSIMPNSNKAHSETASQVSVEDLDKEKSIPIRLNTLIGAVGFAIQAICVFLLSITRRNPVQPLIDKSV